MVQKAGLFQLHSVCMSEAVIGVLDCAQEKTRLTVILVGELRNGHDAIQRAKSSAACL